MVPRGSYVENMNILFPEGEIVLQIEYTWNAMKTFRRCVVMALPIFRIPKKKYSGETIAVSLRLAKDLLREIDEIEKNGKKS